MKKRKFKASVEIDLEIPDDLLDATYEDREYAAEARIRTALEAMSLPEGGKIISIRLNARIDDKDKR